MALRLIRALPGERPLLSPLPRHHGAARIDARVAAPGPHDFAVRCRVLVRRNNPPDAAASIASQAQRIVTIAKRPSDRLGMSRVMHPITISVKQNISFQMA